MLFRGVFAAVQCAESGCGSCGMLCRRASARVEGDIVCAVRRLAVREVRFGVRCGVDLDSPGKRGLDFSEGLVATVSFGIAVTGWGVVRWRLRFGMGCSDGVVGLEYPPRRGSGVIEVGLVSG